MSVDMAAASAPTSALVLDLAQNGCGAHSIADYSIPESPLESTDGLGRIFSTRRFRKSSYPELKPLETAARSKKRVALGIKHTTLSDDWSGAPAWLELL